VVLAAKLVKANGVVSREEIVPSKSIFNIPQSAMSLVGAIFDKAKETANGFEAYVEEVAHLFRSTPAVSENLVGALCKIAKSDGWVDEAELRYLGKVAQAYGLGSRTFAHISAQHAPEDGDDPGRHSVLGVSTDVPDQQLKARYQELVVQHHPDKLITNGMPNELVEKANEKLVFINFTYDKICVQRNIR
jgi:DnaJ like chaperone protein